jgi:RHH-type rel operon transcriptional repressor/antitoxin RelB
MSITMRVSDSEKKMIQNFATLYGMSISDYIRTAVMEKIEDEYDLQAYHKALAEFEKDPTTFTIDEIIAGYPHGKV